IGEGEYTLEEVCDTITNERPFDGVKGIAFRKEDEIIINPRRERISDLNKLPFPARDLLPHYRKRDKSVYYSISEMPDGTKMEFSNISIVTGRGCPFNCLFCAVPETWGKNVKFRSVENIIAEMKHLKRQYDVKRVFFCDDTFNANNERVAHLCTRILEERLDIKWNCQSRVDKVDQKILSLMKEAGCHMVSFGVESGSQHILDDVMSKGITIDGVKKVVKWCDEIGLARNCNFMYSLPGEDMKDLHKTLAFMKELGGKQSLGPTVILPGSRIEKIARTNGLLPENFSWSKISPYKYYEPTSNSFLPIFVDKLSWEEILNVFYKYIKGQSTVRTKNYIFRVAQRLFQVRSLVDLKYIFRNYFIFLKILYTNMFRKK
ncbi:radical SAM protein, partial [Patescibacteria group bacterium]|nr:radical SAM protein [Patescibacteria group bacterium]